MKEQLTGININQKCRQYLVDPSFQVVNRLFALSFEDNAVRIRHARYFPPSVETWQCYDSWGESFWSASKKWFKKMW